MNDLVPPLETHRNPHEESETTETFEKCQRGQEAFKASSALSVWSGGARSMNDLKICSFMSLFASVSLVRQNAFLNRRMGEELVGQNMEKSSESTV